MPRNLELTGVLASSDSFERLRLCFVDGLAGAAAADHSWARLRRAVPESEGHTVPYELPLAGEPDDAGIRGECWVTLPTARSRDARARRARLLALAADLRGREVAVTVAPRRYTFVSRSGHNRGATVTGTSLQLVLIEERMPRF